MKCKHLVSRGVAVSVQLTATVISTEKALGLNLFYPLQVQQPQPVLAFLKEAQKPVGNTL